MVIKSYTVESGYAVTPVGATHNERQDMKDWCIATLGDTVFASDPRWWIMRNNVVSFCFRNDKDRNLFLLRWS